MNEVIDFDKPLIAGRMERRDRRRDPMLTALRLRIRWGEHALQNAGHQSALVPSFGSRMLHSWEDRAISVRPRIFGLPFDAKAPFIWDCHQVHCRIPSYSPSRQKRAAGSWRLSPRAHCKQESDFPE